jgi:hypothetical protein
VTNRKSAGDQVIWWLRERCGKSEEVHSVMKSDLAGGQMPSGLFGADAAWWALTIMAHNLNATMKRLVLGEEWTTKRMKADQSARTGDQSRSPIDHPPGGGGSGAGDHPQGTSGHPGARQRTGWIAVSTCCSTPC